ncbi:MAG: hypothetical protein U1F46_02505 [Marinagarivorans sp.]
MTQDCFAGDQSKIKSLQGRDFDIFMYKHNLSVDKRKKLFYLKLYQGAGVAEVFFLHYVSSGVICVAGSDSYSMRPGGEFNEKPFLAKKYVAVSGKDITIDGCSEKPIEDYFFVKDDFSDGTLLMVHKYVENFMAMEKGLIFNNFHSVELVRLADNSTIYNAKFIKDSDDTLGLSLDFDFRDGIFYQLKKYTYSLE